MRTAQSCAPGDFPTSVNILRLYLRVIGLLAPERKLAITLTLANLALAGVYFLEPMLFGQVVDALGAPGAADAPRLITYWALAGFGGVVAERVGVPACGPSRTPAPGSRRSSSSSRTVHRCRCHSTARTTRPPLARDARRRQQLVRASGSASFASISATLLSILVMVPIALYMNWKLAVLMVALMTSFAVFNAIAIRRTHKAQAEVEELHHEISTRASDVFGHVGVVQSFTRLGEEMAALKDMMARVLKAQYPVLRGWAVLSVLNRAASTLTIVAIFALGANLHAKARSASATS